MGVPPWEFDSPLRHHAYNNGFRESDDFLEPLFFCAFLFLPRYSPVLWAAYTLIIYSLKIHPSNTSVMIAPAETSVLTVILATYERNSMPAGAPFNERSLIFFFFFFLSLATVGFDTESWVSGFNCGLFCVLRRFGNENSSSA